MEAAMVGSMKPAEAGELDALALKFRSLGLSSGSDLRNALRLVKAGKTVNRGASIGDTHCPPRQLTVLLKGVACTHKRLKDGSRRIYTFQYSGDFCDLYRCVLPDMDQTVTVTALTDCSIGTIRYDDLDQMLLRRPKIGLAFWRASMLEASIVREKLLNTSGRAALAQVAGILCEQLARLEAINTSSATIPLTQGHLADAGGISVVRVNRIIRDLRKLGALSNKKRTIEVASRERLAQLANFDGKYLNMRDLLSKWKIDIETDR